jgi:hypothetical protein
MQILKPENRKNSILPAFAVGTFGLSLLTLLLLMFHKSMLQDLESQLASESLVQLFDGRAITVSPKPNLERHPETIRRFVGESMTFLLTWSAKQPPVTIWDSSRGLIANNIKQKFQSEVISLYPGNQFNNQNKVDETVLVLVSISQPIKIGDGKWKLQLIANQLIFNPADNLGSSVAFKKQILVRATEQEAIKIPDDPLALHQAAHRIREAKLEIYNICEISDKNCL